MILSITYPTIDPVALELGPIVIRWYSLAYIVGLLVAWRYCRWLAARPPQRMTPEAFDDFLLWATGGVILGGRLGYVLFYKPGFYLHNPGEALMLWQGGMSFHGGLLGVLLAGLIFARRRGITYVGLMDICACATPIGLFLGRLANFINGELYGRPSDVPWAMVFPSGGPEPRHPSQLYEAGLEGIALFVVLLAMVRFGALLRLGLISGAFLVGYGLSRLIVEFAREPDAHLGTLLAGATMGQLLSLPMIMLGVGLIVWSFRHSAAPKQS
ncbi:MAG: prolipoprotein diacylglyceryl transferase [Pseudomonadota bacterium]